jgi:hypothetical protein
MKYKKWLKYEKSFSRKELLEFCWICSVPLIGWIGLIITMVLKPHDKDGNWILKQKQTGEKK